MIQIGRRKAIPRLEFCSLQGLGLVFYQNYNQQSFVKNNSLYVSVRLLQNITLSQLMFD